MSELQQLPDMTLEEAQAKHAQLKALESVMRSSLLEMRDRKGWKALGYASFSEYGEQEWGFSKSYLHRLANAAEIQKHLSPIGDSDIPESHLRPLSKVSDADKSAVYEEAVERAKEEGKKLGAKMMEEVVADYMAKNSQLQNQLDFATRTYEKVNGEYHQLQSQQQTIINEQVEARIADERATLILENQQAIAENKRLAENAQHELERLKREQGKAVSDGVTLELNKLDTEIKQKRYQVECYERDLADLKKVKSELDAEIGALAVHKETIKNIKEHLSFLTVSFSDAFDTNVIPTEVSGEWDAIYFALSKLKTQMSEWRDRLNPLESHAIIDIETPWRDENVEAFA